MLRPYENFRERPRRRIAQVVVSLTDLASWLDLPADVTPVGLRARDDGQFVFLTVVGDSLDECIWDTEPPIRSFTRTMARQFFDVGDGGPVFERVAYEGSPEAQAMDGLTPEKLLAAVREQVDASKAEVSA